MFFADDSSDSSSDDLPNSYHKEERMTPNICSELETLFKPENALTPSSQIADKFKKCLFTNIKSSKIVEFLDSLLTFIRKGPKDSRKFTRSVCNYLFAARVLASEVAVDECYYDHIRKVLVLYCILELRMVSCIDDDSTVGSDILLKITLLMQGSNAINVIDVLIDIGEQIRSSRSTAIMKIVYRKYLTNSLVGGPVELDDTNFVKHLIVFNLWYKAESITEKGTVLKFFLSTIKPSQQLRSNPTYSPFLQPYNPDEHGDYKRLLQQPFQHKALVMALRDAEISTDYQTDLGKNIFLDLTIDDEAVVIKTEIDLSLNLPNEIINVDDDDVDLMEISYLPNLYQRLDDINQSEQRLMLQKSVPIDTVEIMDSDSEVETNEVDEINNLLAAMENDITNTANKRISPDYSLPLLDDVRPSSSSNLKTYSRMRETGPLARAEMENWLSRSSKIENWLSMQHRRKTLPHNESMPAQLTRKIQPILRTRSFTATLLGKSKKVTFHNPPVTKYVFERRDYDGSSSNNDQDASSADQSYIVTGPQCNFPYVSTGVLRFTSPNSSTPTEMNNVPKESPVEKAHKSHKKRKRRSNNKNVRTSLDNWIKRKKVCTSTNTNQSADSHSEVPEKENVKKAQNDIKLLLSKIRKCHVHLHRYVERPLTKRISVHLTQTNGINVEKVTRLSDEEDMTLKEIIEAKERMLTENRMFENPRQELVSPYKSIQSTVALNDITKKCIIENTNQPLEKSSHLNNQLNASKSKSVIQSINSKSSKQNAGMWNADSASLVVDDRFVEISTDAVDPCFTDCFVLLKRLRGFALGPIAMNYSKSHRRYNQQAKSTSNNDTICRLPTKSPQEYQFKRSFEKIPALEQTSKTQSKETMTPIISLVTSISTAQSPTNDQMIEPFQSTLHVLDSTSTSPQLRITAPFTSQPQEIIPEVEASPLTPSPQTESSNEVSNCPTLSSINCKMKIVREITSCSPDTTTSSTPQYLVISDGNPATESTAENDINETPKLVNFDVHFEKRLRMVYDDCDTDIPSPVYSPYEGKRKNVEDRSSRKFNKLAIHNTSQAINEYVGDTISPIDLTLKLTEKIEYEVDGGTTISSSSTGLIDELNSISSPEIETNNFGDASICVNSNNQLYSSEAAAV